jgi:hypothetical protein
MSYGDVFRILAALFGAEAVIGGPLYGRLKNLTKFGIPLGLQVGTGKKIDYQSEQIYQLAFCLELEDAGIKPVQIARIVKARWSDEIYKFFEQELKSRSDDRALIFATSEMKSGEDDNWIMVPAISGDMLVRAVKKLRMRGYRHATLIDVSGLVRAVEKQRVIVSDALAEGRKT